MPVRNLTLAAAVIVAVAFLGCDRPSTPSGKAPNDSPKAPDEAVNPGGPTKGKVYRTADGLFDAMPKHAWPKGGDDGVFAREDAKKWLKEKFTAGQIVEWELEVKSVIPEPKGDGLFDVSVFPKVPRVRYGLGDRLISHGDGWALGSPIRFGDNPCLVLMIGRGHNYQVSEIGPRVMAARVKYAACSRKEAEALKKLEDNKAVFQGKIDSADVATRIFETESADGTVRRFTGKEEPAGLIIVVPQLSVNGVLPGKGVVKE